MSKSRRFSQWFALLKTHKWWFLTPMLIVLALILLLIFLGGDNTVPFIYQL